MKLFRKPSVRYARTPEPKTPYQRAAQAWDERIGSARVQARNWRLMAFGSLALAGGFAAALVWQSTRGTVVPWIVQVDRFGEAQAVAPAVADYRPTDPQIAWFLGRFITGVRARSLDPVLMRENWLSAYDFATERASLFLGEYARTSNPFADVGRKTVSVQVTSIVRASDTSFQVKWTEQQYERGSLASTSRWTAMLTVKIKPPRSADVLRKNPLGLYVDAIDWSRELETPQDRPPSPQPSAVPDPAQSLPVAPPADIPLGSPLDPTLAQPAAAPSPERTDQ